MTDRLTRRGLLRSAGLGVPTLFAGRARTAVTPSRGRRDERTEFSAKTRRRARTVGQRVRRSVVKITETGTEHTLGTGWVVDDGSLVTNAHLVQRTETVEIETFDERTGPATRAGYHRDLRPDIALLRTDLETPPPLSVDATATVTTGEPVIAVGHPAPVGDWVISLGRYDSYDPRTKWLLAVVPTADGNSGSPLVTLDGDVVGCVNGTSRTERERARLDRPEAVYTAYESRTTVATATPGKTITEWVSKWR